MWIEEETEKAVNILRLYTSSMPSQEASFPLLIGSEFVVELELVPWVSNSAAAPKPPGLERRMCRGSIMHRLLSWRPRLTKKLCFKVQSFPLFLGLQGGLLGSRVSDSTEGSGRSPRRA